jgi:nucleotide-binding universal stress UspA family protein
MFNKALVSVDRSTDEQPLLSRLSELTRWGVSSFVLAHVILVDYVRGAEYGHEDECRRWIEKSAEPLRKKGMEFEISVTDSGIPADELLRVASEKNADLIVIGWRSHNLIHDLFLGSVAKDLIRKTAIPVLIERLKPMEAGTAESGAAVCSEKLDRILLATDLSERSRTAEDTAVSLAPNAARLDCLTVLPPEDADLGVDNAVRAGKKLSAIIKRIEAAGGHGHSRIEHGDPAEVIARVGQEGCSLIVVGKHGKNWIEGMVSGNTAAKVCELAKCPVLMVPLGKG